MTRDLLAEAREEAELLGQGSPSPGMEEVQLGGHTIELPTELCTNQAIFQQFFSIDTWNDLLPEEVKLGLLDLLPSFEQDDIDEKAKTIEMLFGGENFHFGNPVARFRSELAAGELQPERAAMKEMVRSAQRRDYAEGMDRCTAV
jgi:nuclear factor related to kappa-B-binding protein